MEFRIFRSFFFNLKNVTFNLVSICELHACHAQSTKVRRHFLLSGKFPNVKVINGNQPHS